MKIIYWSAGTLLALILSFLILQTVASERVEVVELTTVTETGESKTTRLWVVEDEGYQYLRASKEGPGWFNRLQNNDEIKVMRNERQESYNFVLRPDKSERINQLMQEKYTWGDKFFAIVLGAREGSIPVELHPV